MNLIEAQQRALALREILDRDITVTKSPTGPYIIVRVAMPKAVGAIAPAQSDFVHERILDKWREWQFDAFVRRVARKLDDTQEMA